MASISPEKVLYSETDIEQIFRSQVETWKRDTEFLSSTTQMVGHPAYLRIIGLGRQALPLLLAELQTEPDRWFPALIAISGTNPARPEDTFPEKITRWIEWGRMDGWLA